jgi:hypothetical protein
VRRFSIPLLLAALVLAGCADDRVSLSYRLEEGRRLRYSLLIEAEINRTLGEDTRRQQIEAAFRASQEVLEELQDGAFRVRTTLDPVSLVVDGTTRSVGPGQEFLVTLGPDGRVQEVQRARGEASEPLALVGIDRLLPRLRPVLPGRPVSPGDAWASDSELRDEDGTFTLESRSRLAELGRTAGHPAALVRTTYTSPVDRREVFANAAADLNGRDVGTQEAWFALDGFLVGAVGDSVGRYRVTFRPPGGDTGVAPVEGRLVVRVHTEMRLVP